MSVILFYVQAVLIILAAAIGLALNVTVTEFIFDVTKTIQIKIFKDEYAEGIVNRAY